VQQAEQPFEGEDAAGVVRLLGELARFADHQLGMLVRTPHADRQIGQHDVQETACPLQRFGQGWRRQAAATEEFKTADAHRLREQAEAFVIELAVEQVVERGVIGDRNPAGGVCKIDVAGSQQGAGVDAAPRQAGQHPGNKTHRNSGLRTTW